MGLQDIFCCFLLPLTGDVGDPVTLYTAVQGGNKIIYCATALSIISGDLYRADQGGVYNLTKAFQDYNNKMAQLRAGKSSKSKLTIVKFKTLESVDGWEVRQGTYFGSDPRPVNACVQRIVMAARSCRSGKLF
ncbi:protein HIGH CHLOROPHYLL FLUORESCENCE PHENOTYPE 173, chloroplastic-like isoform X1 [Malus domestica]|uniref:protein HIGH CHLOROPHYLL FLUORESCENCE PHENOTYPE 173, chloroplastic-like isoform X1 n=1 Tax=Malus domestica TaxID=3750 RepID=UPI000498FC1A|nr:uncharacterized protein LOC103438466 [Malus domestica]